MYPLFFGIFEYILLAAYLLTMSCLLVYGLNCYYLMSHYRSNLGRARSRRIKVKEAFYREISSGGWPSVTIQLPVYNERYVIERLIRSVCNIDYPRDAMEIQVLDDSTDVCAEVAARTVKEMRGLGYDISHIRRPVREGYKAGALMEGFLRAKGEFIAVFDGDFVPAKEFIKETVPYFSDLSVGMVQARWGHLNFDYSLLTRAQSIGIDGHFGVEQAARSWGGFFMNFNGTAGIWRRSTIEDAGGWQADTLTEDLDLSYRAQLKGWKLEFVPDVVCPAELPVTINAFKSQQHRWAKGSIQTARKHLGGIFRADIPPRVKLQALIHLTHYMVHLFMLVVVLTSVPLLYSRFFVSGGVRYPLLYLLMFCLATFGPSTMYMFSQRVLYADWKKRLKYLPFLMCLGVGVSANNAKAVLEGLFSKGGGFTRTPKFGIERSGERWRDKLYESPLSSLSMLELFIGSYSIIGLVLLLGAGRFLIIPFLFLYAAGFLYTFYLSVSQAHGKR